MNLRALLLAIVLCCARLADAAQGPSRPTELLGELCKTHQDEPVCAAPGEISEDQAWLVLRTACRSDETEMCRRFRQQQGGVMVFDARSGSWQAWWESQPMALHFDVAGTPTLRLKPDSAKPLRIVATNLSPLVYSAAAGTPKEEDLEVIAGLKTVLALAGTGIQSLVQTVAFSPPPAARVPGVSIESPSASARPGGRGGVPPQLLACEILPPDIAALAGIVGHRNMALVTLGASMQALQGEIVNLEDVRNRFVRLVQASEEGRPDSTADMKTDLGTAIAAAYDRLQSDAKPLVVEGAQLTQCQPLLAAYSSLLTAPPHRRVIDPLVDQVNAAAATCPLPALRRSVQHNAGLLRQQCDGQVEATLRLHGAAMKPIVDRLLSTGQAEEKVWTAVDRARMAKSAVLATADTLDRQVRNARMHRWNGALITEIAVTRPNPELRWNKVQTHSIVLKIDTPYAKELTLAHGPEEKHEYRLESATGQLLGYGIGMIYTPLYESTWAATSVPGTNKKVIAETKRETRAGGLAAFVTYRFMEHRPASHVRPLRPALDFGVGLSTDYAAFFLGGALEVMRAARIGVGWAPERVTKLAAGQTANVTEVSSNDDIRTVRAFETRNWYVSFTFALDSLSLFNKSP